MQLKWVLILKNTNGFDFASGDITLISRMLYHHFLLDIQITGYLDMLKNRNVTDTCKWCLMSVDGISF